MRQFIPPSFNLPMAWAVDISLPVLLKQIQNIDEVVFEPGAIAKLRDYRKERFLYCSNHPSQSEPPVAYYIANRMGTRFHYMASRQIFEWGYGMVGRFIQGLGAYSVLPGAADRDSVRTSRSILASPGGKLVVFPEGEPTSGENDSLMPLQSGMAQLAFRGLEDARKTDPDARLYILPAFVKYVISGTDASIKAELHQSLQKIERKFRFDPGNRNLLRRFLYIGRLLLEKAEEEYSIPAASNTDYNYRVGRVRHLILDRVADRLQLASYDRRADAIIKLRSIMTVIEMFELKYDDASIKHLKKADIEFAKRESSKAYDFIVIKPEYLLEHPSAERLFEWLYRYESYFLNQNKMRARRAHVFFADPVDISAYLESYHNNKRQAIDTVTAKVNGALQVLRKKGIQLTPPLVRAGDLEMEET